MAQDQPPRLRCECYLSRLARRRMPRLLGPLLLLLPKRRLVNQKIRPLCRIDDRCAGPGVTGEHHEPSRAVGPHNAFRSHGPTVRQSDRFALAEPAPQRAFRDPRRPRLVHVEPPAPLVLAQRVTHRSATVLGPEYVDLGRLPPPGSRLPNHFAWLHLADLDLERNTLHSQLDRLAKHLLRPFRPVQ